MFVWKIWGECQFQEKEVNVIKDGFCAKNMRWRSGFVPWFSLHHILGGEVFEMKRNAFGNLGALQKKDFRAGYFFCGVYGS